MSKPSFRRARRASNSFHSASPVVVAARVLEAGTKLAISDVEVVQIRAGAVLKGAFETVEDVVGLVITVQHLPGDQVTADMIGDAAQHRQVGLLAGQAGRAVQCWPRR
jgi:flagella basal body P-ring formation protein FlgA